MDEKQLSQGIGILLRKQNCFLATAESCSGGLMGHTITEVAGSSEYYLGGVVAYSNDAKQVLLGVQEKTLLQYGAVSRETALEMAAGVRNILAGSHPSSNIIGVSISGIAGPGGGTQEKPVGTVWIGVSAGSFNQAWLHLFQGNRSAIKQQSVLHALKHLQTYLNQTA